MVLGGSTNTVLHLLAVAHEIGVRLELQTFHQISRIVKLKPADEYFLKDFWYVGGVQAVMMRL
nr:dihydroxy-acid dehydratase [Gelria sp. Kuro-4]